MQLYIDTKNTEITVKNKCFLIKNLTQQKIISPKRIESIGILSNIKINSSAIKLAAQNEIPIYFYDFTGKVVSELSNPNYLKHSILRKNQLLFCNQTEGQTWILDQLILKTNLQVQTLKRAAKETPSIAKKLKVIIESIETKKLNLKDFKLNNSFNRNAIMGVEGGIARAYFKAINLILPVEFQFIKRSRRPAKDNFNASLNYLYGMTYGQVTKAIKASGLDVYVGVLHITNYKESLVYDCIEPFRPIIDRLLINLCKQEKLKPNHFIEKNSGIWLGKEGKKVILPAYAELLDQRIKIENRVLSIRNHIYWQSRNLKQKINDYDIPYNV